MNKMLNSDMSSNPVLIMLMFVLVIIIFLAIFRSVSPFLTMGLGFNAHVGSLRGSFNIEAFENNMKQPTFVIFYADWCGHCKRTMPEFKKFQDSYKGGKVRSIAINSDDKENAELIKSQNIQGFPTIRYYPRGMLETFEEYNGERTASAFSDYVSKIEGVMDVAPDNAAPV